MANCINLIKLSIKNNKKGFIISSNNKNLNIIKAFMRLNIIKYISIIDSNIIVYINYIDNEPVFKNIVNMFKTSNKKFINLKNLKKLNLRHKWLLIISTNKGILNSIEANKLKIGGLILAKIWN